MHCVEIRIVCFNDNRNTHLAAKEEVEGYNEILGRTVYTERNPFSC